MSYGIHRSRIARTARCACVIGLTGVLATSGAITALTSIPARAHAATEETLAELNKLQNQVSGAAATYADATAKAGELNAEVRAIADEIIDIEQNLLPARQQRAADAASNLYKNRASHSGAVSLLLNADSFADFINLVKYLGTVQSANVSALNELNELENELNGKLNELSQAKDQADAELARASTALGDAQSAASKLQAKANAEDAAEAEIARKAAEQAAELQAQQNANQNTSGQQGGTEPAEPQKPNEGGDDNKKPEESQGGDAGTGNAGGNSGGSANGNSGDSDTTGSWKTGVASYYGIGDGFMGGTTASGEKVTETSMGIAMLNVPFGTRVEIRYGGRSVIAYVNDRGPYAHGRVIDMQPAVARALNFLSVGVGTVQYRFL